MKFRNITQLRQMSIGAITIFVSQMKMMNYLKLGILFPLTRLVEGVRCIIETDLDNRDSPVSRLRCSSYDI